MNSENSTRISTPDPELVLRLSATRCGARLARHHTVRQLHAWGLPHSSGTSDDAAAVVAELAANAVTHGRVPGRDFELRLVLGADAVGIEVSDTRTERKLPARGDLAAPAAEAESGRGLLIVETLARAWGVTQRSPGKTVWADIARTADAASTEAR